MHTRPMTTNDADTVIKIHQDGIDTGNATFADTAPDWDTFNTTHLTDHRFVTDSDGDILGWIAAAPTSSRHVYRGVVEHSVYVAAHARGRGVGSALLNAFIASTEASGIWTIQAGIFPDNTASLDLHEQHGFRIVGIRERLGQTTTGHWRDVALLERRSPTI